MIIFATKTLNYGIVVVILFTRCVVEHVSNIHVLAVQFETEEQEQRNWDKYRLETNLHGATTRYTLSLHLFKSAASHTIFLVGIIYNPR